MTLGQDKLKEIEFGSNWGQTRSNLTDVEILYGRGLKGQPKGSNFLDSHPSSTQFCLF